MTRMLASLLIAVSLCGAYPHEVAAARIDKAAYGESAKYLDLGSVPEDRRDEAMTALRYWLPHLSRAVVLDHQRPIRIPGTALYRIDIDLLGWGWRPYVAIAREYPYALFVDSHGVVCRDQNPLIIRADWLLRVTADANESDAYYELLYAGKKIPRTLRDFQDVFGVRLSDTDDLDAGTIIDRGRSGVALNTRLLRWSPSARGYYFETYDSRDGSGANDPLEHLSKGTKFDPSQFKFDAQEAIVGLPKVDLVTGARGTAQAYILTDGKGNVVDIADGTIVVDHSKLFGVPQIRTPGSCVQCHAGLNGPQENLLRSLIAEGLEVTTKDQFAKEFLERFYLSELGTVVAEGNASFARFTQAACGCEPADAIADWQRTVTAYENAVDLPQAALELATDEPTLRNAIAYYSDLKGPQVEFARLAALAHGRPMDRKSFEKNYGLALTALHVWRTKQ